MERQKASLTGGVMAAAITLFLWWQAIAGGAAAGSNNGPAGYAARAALINPAVLQVLLANKKVKVIDVRPPEQYQAGHIPGAINMGVSDYAGTPGTIPELGHLAAVLGKRGITNQDTLVLYAGNDKHGPAYSAHLWWLLDMAGHYKVKLLDGGLRAWETAGYGITDRAAAAAAGHFQIIGPETGKLAVMAEVLAAVEQPDPGTVILDVREWPEFAGAVQAPGAARPGRIPGAVWLYWADTLNGDQTLKTAGELKQLFAARGVTPDKRVIIYCQAGVRAAHTAYVLSELLGYKQVQNYAGSWAEWSRNRELPADSGRIAGQEQGGSPNLRQAAGL